MCEEMCVCVCLCIEQKADVVTDPNKGFACSVRHLRHSES